MRVLVYAVFITLSIYALPNNSKACVNAKLAHPFEDGSPMDRAAKDFSNLVAERSGGDICVDIFPQSSLGNSDDLIEGLRLATVEMQ